MKVINLNPINYYSCQFCERDFESDKELIIIKGNSPLCSQLCLFRFIFKILKGYDKNELDILAKELCISQKPLSLSHNLVYNLTKVIIKTKIPNINIEAQGSGSSKQAQIPEQKQAQAQHTLYNRVLSLSAEPINEGGIE